MENNLSRALTISDGSFAFLWERPLTLGIVSVALIVLIIPPLIELLRRSKTKEPLPRGPETSISEGEG
jgi:putative tricarboxylic transport membrane protein